MASKKFWVKNTETIERLCKTTKAKWGARSGRASEPCDDNEEEKEGVPSVGGLCRHLLMRKSFVRFGFGKVRSPSW